MAKHRFTGTMSALPTPFDASGKLLKKTVRELVEWEIQQGTYGFYVCGSTGEGPVLPASVRKEMLEEVLDTVKGRVPVIAHTGSIDCAAGVDLTKHATAAGANGISSVPPNFYFTYNETEIVEYYKRMAGSTNLPFILYAVPYMANLDINGMMAKLLSVENICGLKDTRANYYAMWQLRQLNNGDINIINGPDEMLICGLTMGADGGIGSTYNVMTDWYANLFKKFTAGDFEGARQQQYRINKVIQVLLKYGCLPAIKAYLTAKGFDMGVPAFPKPAIDADTAAKLVKEIDALKG